MIINTGTRTKTKWVYAGRVGEKKKRKIPYSNDLNGREQWLSDNGFIKVSFNPIRWAKNNGFTIDTVHFCKDCGWVHCFIGKPSIKTWAVECPNCNKINNVSTLEDLFSAEHSI